MYMELGRSHCLKSEDCTPKRASTGERERQREITTRISCRQHA